MIKKYKLYLVVGVVVLAVFILTLPILIFGYVHFMNKLSVYPVRVELLESSERGFFGHLEKVDGYDYRQFATCRFMYCKYDGRDSFRPVDSLIVFRDDNELFDRSLGRVTKVLRDGYEISIADSQGVVESKVIKKSWVLGKD